MVNLVLAAFLAAHGLVHGMFLVPRPPASADAPTWPFDMTDSWLVRHAGLTVRAVRGLGAGLAIVTIVGFGLSALATVGWLVPADLWAPLVLGSAAASALLLGLCFNPRLVLGFAIDGALVWAAVVLSWSPAVDTA